MTRLEATLKGAREVGFTVLAMEPVPMIAVFSCPFWLMGGDHPGGSSREFAITSGECHRYQFDWVGILLTTTPMLCAHLDLH